MSVDWGAVAARVFKEESARILAGLIRLSGSFDWAEEAMQDAFTRALTEWPEKGVPTNPGAWITTVARRRIVDRARREATRTEYDPENHGLLALMLLIDARRNARVDDHGSLLTLDEQDRSRWDWPQIDEGMVALARALGQATRGPYVLQAAIAGTHARARMPEDTDWAGTEGLYCQQCAQRLTPGSRRSRIRTKHECPPRSLIPTQQRSRSRCGRRYACCAS